MKITRSQLVAMIREAVIRRVMELHEAGAEPDDVEAGDDDLKKQKKKLADRNTDPQEVPPPEVQGDPADAVSGVTAPDDEEENPAGVEPPDEEEEQPGQADALDVDGDADEETMDGTGEVNEFALGKTVQSISIEDSKEIAGNKEVVITFDQTTEPLRIMVTPQGGIAFRINNQMHDLP